MTEEEFAFQCTAIIFVVSLALILLSLLVERFLESSNDAKLKRTFADAGGEDMDEADDSSWSLDFKVDDAEPEFKLWKRPLQKMQQLMLDYPSQYALCVLLLTLLKFFTQIFDIFTDATIANIFWDGASRSIVGFTISVVLMTAPWVCKWMALSNFISQKCNQKILPQWISYVDFFFPLGVFSPIFADLYIISRVVKGQFNAFLTGEAFHLDDALFSLQRTFALREVQTESMPQALFQLGYLITRWGNKDAESEATLIILSVSVSIFSVVTQFLSLQSLAKKESYQSAFAMIQALSQNEFIAGINQIRQHTSSILNLNNVPIDQAKMRIISELIDVRPHVHTVILNTKVPRIFFQS